MKPLKVDLEDISIELLSDEQFDFKHSSLEAKSILNSLFYDDILHPLIRLEFDDNTWILPNNYHGTLTLDFSIFQSELKLSTLDILRIKCWIAKTLQRVTTLRAQTLLNRLIFTIRKTNYFDINKSEEFADYLRTTKDISNMYKLSIIQVTLNFLDYNLFETSYNSYDKALYSLSKSIKPENSTRELPTATDMIVFDSWVEQFYHDEIAKNEISPTLIRYYPIVMWWKLTTIIPIRPIEFCDISRDALSEDKEGKFHLKLPRKKNKNNIQIIDKIHISKDLGEIIKHYLNITKNFGKSNTLISYRSIQSTYPEQHIKTTNVTKINPNLITTGNFKWLLVNFHSEILEGKYNLKIPAYARERHPSQGYDLTKQITPGDTRHIAIMSLISQKYHPIEIARLAGHRTLSAYFHYSNHKSYWIDLEVQKLLFKFQREKNSIANGNYETSQNLWAKITNRSLYKPPTNNYQEKMKIGFCTDNQKRCFTDCILCQHWRISTTEFNTPATQKIIQQAIQKHTNTATNLLTDLFNLIQALNLDEFTSINPEIKNTLDQKTMAFNEMIQQIAKVKYIKEEKLIND
ncbi:hypothetical protein [Bacillus sp. 1A]|uniref:hypothetical protein n=1 Tax=Bacillus sp. 1A TaxID=3461399 RepID=UPI004043A35A